MKKIMSFLLIIISFFFYIQNTYADEIKSFSCEYQIYKEDTFNSKLVIEVTDYDSSKRSGKINIQYQKDDGSMENVNPGTNVFNAKGSNGSKTIQFFKRGESKYVSLFNGNCQKVYLVNLSGDNSTFTIQSEAPSKDNSFPTFPLSPTNALINGRPADEYKRENSNTNNLKEERCKYTLPLYGTKKISFEVIREYNLLKNEYSYRISYEGSEYPVDVNSEFSMPDGFPGSDKRIRMRVDQIKKIVMSDKCLEGNKIYSYQNINFDYYLTTDPNEVKNDAVKDEYSTLDGEVHYDLTELDISAEPMTCEEILSYPLNKIVKSSIRIIQIVAAIMAIVKGMLLIVPAVTSKDAEALHKVSGTLVKLAIVLVIIFILAPTVRIFGSLLGYDVSCFV